MAACYNCGQFIYRKYYDWQEEIFCCEDCKNTYEIKQLPLNIPCCCCNKQIIISEGVWVKGKNVFCSSLCLNQFITNNKKLQNE